MPYYTRGIRPIIGDPSSALAGSDADIEGSDNLLCSEEELLRLQSFNGEQLQIQKSMCVHTMIQYDKPLITFVFLSAYYIIFHIIPYTWPAIVTCCAVFHTCATIVT